MQPSGPGQRPSLRPQQAPPDRDGRRRAPALQTLGVAVLLLAIVAATVVALRQPTSSTVASTPATVPTSAPASSTAAGSGDPPGSSVTTVAGASATTPVTRATGRIDVYDGGFAPGWGDYGWSERSVGKGPARVEVSGYGGLVFGFTSGSAALAQQGPYVGLELGFSAPTVDSDFLFVRLGDEQENPFPEQRAGWPAPDASGYRRVTLSFRDLNPKGAAFDRIVFRAARPLPKGTSIAIDAVRLLSGDPMVGAVTTQASQTPGTAAASAATSAPATTVEPVEVRPVTMALDCTSSFPINPRIYGIGYDAVAEDQKRADHQWTMGATNRRWGGNPTSRFNWRLGNAWSTAFDYFYRNVEVRPGSTDAVGDFLRDNRTNGMLSSLTVPMLDWVAKDTTSFSFPVSVFGPQQQTDPWVPDAGNGMTPDGKRMKPGPATRTSVRNDAASIGEWVRRLVAASDDPTASPVDMYFLDNEPELWHETHRDVRTEPLGYDELLEKSVAFASAIKAADPNAVVAGPSPWGWLAYQYSGIDAAAGYRPKPDRKRHGDTPLLQWYLREMRKAGEARGTRLLDVLDVHFYPAAEGLYGAAGGGATDPESAARRIRSVRSLWDPTYRDESWIDEKIRLFPRLQEWIDDEYPGTGISVGEWSFGADRHMSGGLATAEALGRFGTNRVRAASYWTFPAADGPTYWAFRAFRDVDRTGLRFRDTAIAASVDDEGTFGDVLGDGGVSIFGSIEPSTGEIVAVVLNTSPSRAAEATVALQGCGTRASAEVRTYTGAATGFTVPLPAVISSGSSTGSLQEPAVGMRLAPYSISVLRIPA